MRAAGRLPSALEPPLAHLPWPEIERRHKREARPRGAVRGSISGCVARFRVYSAASVAASKVRVIRGVAVVYSGGRLVSWALFQEIISRYSMRYSENFSLNTRVGSRWRGDGDGSHPALRRLRLRHGY